MTSPGFSTSSLEQYLIQHIPDVGVLQSCSKFADGQSNPTFLLHTSTGRFVLRKKPDGVLLKSAHAVEREYRVLKALSETEVPVPSMIHLCEDPDIIGSSFYIMTYINGRTFWDPSAPELSPEERRILYRNLNKTLARIHSVDLNQVGLDDYGRPGNYFDRQYQRWVKQYRLTETESIPEMDLIIDWLGENMVADDGQVALVHGDYRIDNLLFDADDLSVLAVIDWELSTLGHPFADLAYQCALWRMPPTAGLPGLKGVPRNQLGLPSDEEYLEAYCTERNLNAVENWEFYLVFSLFRMAAIVQGVKKRAIDGSASNERAMDIGSLAQPLAREGALLIEEK